MAANTLWTATKSASRATTFAAALQRHARAWGELWERCDVDLPGNERVQLLLRLHISHILQVCSRHTIDLDAGVPARGLNGEAYRGHIFWDTPVSRLQHQPALSGSTHTRSVHRRPARCAFYGCADRAGPPTMRWSLIHPAPFIQPRRPSGHRPADERP